MILAWLAKNWRLIGSIAAVVIAVVAFRAFVQHERERGAAEVKAAVEAAVTAERERVRAEEEKRRKESEKIGDHYVDTITKPVVPGPVVRVCRPAADSPRRVLSTAGSPSDNHAAAPVRSEDTVVATDWDTTPTIAVGRDADAQVAALQDYINRVCLRR